MQAQLYLPRRRPDSTDQAKAAVIYVVVRIPVAGNVEDVEKVSAEAEDVPLPDMEVLEQRSVHLPVTGSAFRTVLRGAELKVALVAVGTDSIVDAEASTGRC